MLGEGLGEGQPFGYEQVGIEHNHLAVVDRGRAGPDCALRLDAEGNVEAPTPQPPLAPEDAPPVDKQSPPPSNVGGSTPLNPAPPGAEENPPMDETEVYINGVEHKVSKAVAAAISADRAKLEMQRAQLDQRIAEMLKQNALAAQEKATAEATAATSTAEADAAKAKMELAQSETTMAKADAAAARAELATARADADTAKARADSAESELKKEQKARADSEDPTKLQQRVDARMALLRVAEPVLGKNYKFDGQDDHKVRLDALDKLLAGDANKDLKAALDTRRDNAVYVEALFTSQMDWFRRNGGRADQDAPLRTPPAPGGGNGAKTPEQWAEYSRNAHRGAAAPR